jgi:hypothetical protein
MTAKNDLSEYATAYEEEIAASTNAHGRRKRLLKEMVDSMKAEQETPFVYNIDMALSLYRNEPYEIVPRCKFLSKLIKHLEHFVIF